MTFTSFLKAIARYRLRKPKLFLPTPVFIVRALGRLFPAGSAIGKSFTRLNSLFDLPIMNTAHDLEALGLRLRPMPIGMRRGKSGTRRHLLEEGAILLRYVLGTAPAGSLLRRYARAMEQINAKLPPALPTMIRLFPKALALLEKRLLTPGARNDALAFRLHAAITLAEATPQGVRLFRGDGLAASFFDILRACFSECLARFLQIFSWPLLRVLERQKEMSSDV